MFRFGIIGFPVAHSGSKALFRDWCAGKWEYDLIETPDFDEAWNIFVTGPYKAVNVTSPFKVHAAQRADIMAPEVERTGAANILVKTTDGIVAHNSDYLGLCKLLDEIGEGCRTVAVIGFGGAGRAALAAAEDAGLETALYRHDGICEGVGADIIIYTLPSAVPGIDKLICRHLVEANYKSPCLSDHENYISGLRWLKLQAETGYDLFFE